jgi:hypothetical protein
MFQSAFQLTRDMSLGTGSDWLPVTHLYKETQSDSLGSTFSIEQQDLYSQSHWDLFLPSVVEISSSCLCLWWDQILKWITDVKWLVKQKGATISMKQYSKYDMKVLMVF